jgi:hypothetical protein
MQAAFETIAIMSQRNGRWRGEADNSPGHQDLQVCDWLRAGDFHDVQDPTSPEDLLVHKQDEYVVAADFRPLGPSEDPESLSRLFLKRLAGGVHTWRIQCHVATGS